LENSIRERISKKGCTASLNLIKRGRAEKKETKGINEKESEFRWRSEENQRVIGLRIEGIQGTVTGEISAYFLILKDRSSENEL